MPRTRVVIYKEEDGAAPFLSWFLRLPDRAQDKVRLRVQRLAELGHELRRPEADYLRDGIHELRATVGGVHYRVLYFFHGQLAAVLGHGIVKQRRVPDREINLAISRKRKFEGKPEKYTLEVSQTGLTTVTIGGAVSARFALAALAHGQGRPRRPEPPATRSRTRLRR